MRFGEVFRYELSHRLRSVSTWLYAGILLFLGFYIMHVAVTGTNPIHVNAPQGVAEKMALLGLFSILVTAGLFADAAIRDRAAGMDPLLFTTRLRPAEYVGGRFLAALAINSILVLAIPIGLAIGTKMPYLPRDAFGPNHFVAYLQPVLLFLLPNVVLAGAILFTIAALTRRAVPVYLGAIAIFVGYLVAAGYWSGITNPILSALADPLGINALKAMTAYWTASERNVRLIGFPSMLLWNRLLWLAIAAVLFAVLQRTFRFTQRKERGRGSKTVDAPAVDERQKRHSGTVPQHRGVFGSRTRMRQTLAVTRQSLGEAMSGFAFPVTFLAAIGLVVIMGWNVGATAFDTVTWPVTHLVAGVVLSQSVIAIPWLVIALFAGELVWKDRETGAAQIADVAPVRTGVVLLGRFLALVSIIALFQLAFMIGGMLLQALHGYYKFEPGLYVRILFGWNLVEYILLAVFALTVHVLVNHKYVGHVLVLLAAYLNNSALSSIHHLLIYNAGPGFTYSEMNGFGPFVTPFVWFKLYWASWAILLAIVTMLFWVRGPELGMRQRLATARARFTARTARLATLAVVLILAIGGFIFYNTNVLNAYLPPQKAGLPKAEYERRYGQYENLPQPVITGAQLRLEVYPDTPAVDMKGSYRLVNQTGVPIRSVHVETPGGGDYEVRSMQFDRASKTELVDPKHGYRIFALERALAPGESMQFTFDTALRPLGFEHGGSQTDVVRNGSYFDRRLLPFIGYQPGLEVATDFDRKVYGLPPQPMPGPGDPAARKYFHRYRDGARMHVETIVGTAADQIAVVPGVLRRSWTENGRRYFHYGTRVPETFGTAVFSAKYAVSKDRWKDVDLEIFHHPAHRVNLDRMMSGMKGALDYYTSAYGPFPYREMRIVEVPPYSINGRAFPSALALAEPNFITRTGPGIVDLTFFGTAHEVAHQWFGGQVRPAYAKGRGFVSETLANYSAMLVTEKVLGPAEARRVYDFQMNRYLQVRGETGKDVPLLEVEDHPHVSYGKGAVVMFTLREHIGTEAVNGALRRFLEKYRGSGPPYPTSLDLYAELRAVTPPSLYPLLTDLFETITLWDVKTQRATSRRLSDGKYEVTLEVMAQKLRADGSGVETATPMNDLIEVGTFAAGKDVPVYVTRHRIRTGTQTIRIIVPQEPALAGVDPNRKLIEREREDNLAEVETGG
ncbi:MAG TPA: M1 family aminopeptidase [Thermoanaerobaculia bacterium]|nr:M1 family aminopeptidase [Thermoanaerobaculia bacterium]